jgi:hypothetical protein
MIKYSLGMRRADLAVRAPEARDPRALGLPRGESVATADGEPIRRRAPASPHAGSLESPLHSTPEIS